jgi:hypothetical protein
MEVSHHASQSQRDEKIIDPTESNHDKQGYSHHEDVRSDGYADESGAHEREPPVSTENATTS